MATAKVIMICGRICSGKTVYAKRLCRKRNAVLLSVDEIMLVLFGQHAGERHDEYAAGIKKYLLEKSLEITAGGVDVVFDWGAWTRAERGEISKFFKSRGIGYELHFINISDEVWKKRIESRNREISVGKMQAYYVDEKLAAKFNALFEPPTDEEIDVRITDREN